MSAQSLQPVDLVIWARNTRTAELLSTWFDTWAEQNAPGSTLQVIPFNDGNLNNQLLTANASDLPDIIVDVGWPLASYANAGLLQGLDGYIDTSPYDFAALSAAQAFGSTFGIPLYSGGHTLMVINTSLVSSAPQTFDEVFALAGQFSGSGVNALVYPIDDPNYLLPFAFGFGGEVMDASGSFTLNDAAWASAFEFVQQLSSFVQSGCDIECTNTQFLNGQAAMAITDDSLLADVLQMGLSNVQVIPFPLLSNSQSPRAFINTEFASITINATDAKFDAALAFLNWVTTNPDVVLNAASEYGRLPADVSLLSDSTITSNLLLSASLDVYHSGITLPANTYISCVWEALESTLNDVLSGSLTPQDAAAQAQQSADQCAQSIG